MPRKRKLMPASTAKQTSAPATVSQKQQQCNDYKWESDTIGRFLMDLYRSKVFGPQTNWFVPKNILRKKFAEFLQLSENSNLSEKFLRASGSIDIGFLLRRTNFLIGTPRGDWNYVIKTSSLFRFGNQQMEEFDNKNKRGRLIEPEQLIEDQATFEMFSAPGHVDSVNAAEFQVDGNATIHQLEYQGGEIQEYNAKFQLSNTGCYICQCNFLSQEALEEHIGDHGQESNFKLLSDYSKNGPTYFTLTYCICKNSHYFRFTMKSAEKNVVIEKVIVVQSHSFYYVHNSRVPFTVNEVGSDDFFLDAYLFQKNVEQPIVIVFHKKDSSQKRIIEQHHFLRKEEFPVVRLGINPCHVSNRGRFDSKKLPIFNPPVEILNVFKGGNIEHKLCQMSNDFCNYMVNDKRLTQKNVNYVLRILLQLEDSDTSRKYQHLWQRDVKFHRFENEYSFKIKIPNGLFIDHVILPYDNVVISPMDNQLKSQAALRKEGNQNTKRKNYYGQVERFENGRVTVKCYLKIPEYKLYSVRFKPSRITLRYQYYALKRLAALEPSLVSRFLFPEQVLVKELPPCQLDLLNKNIYDNPEQYRAIRHIAAKDTKQAAPYIIFGPPGTGKTTTIVEAIWQVYNLQPQSKILIMAGSNGACDEIASRLCEIISPLDQPKSITRIYARSYEKRSENLTELLLDYSNMYSTHFYPSVEVLHEYRIIVCTLSVVGYLSTGNFGSGVFTHIFIDEVAASTECETLVGLANTINDKVNLIISGDHKQLGPILNSDRAAKLGLNKSLMERLLQRDCYRVDEFGNYNTSIQSRLCRNYRSHPAIVDLYNHLYYSGELKAMAPPDVKKLSRNWYRIPYNNFPIIFHSVYGTQQREYGGSSWYNAVEISAVLDYVKDLMYFGVNGETIEQTDIGIISPYRKQYMRIQAQLNSRGWYQIETGSVETFQGKEKKIIIASFVRSFSNGLGFLECPKRLNVLLSRAKSILILIGNPYTLSMNSDLKQVIDKCVEERSMIGANYELINPVVITKNNNTTGIEKLTSSLKDLKLNKNELNKNLTKAAEVNNIELSRTNSEKAQNPEDKTLKRMEELKNSLNDGTKAGKGDNIKLSKTSSEKAQNPEDKTLKTNQMTPLDAQQKLLALNLSKCTPAVGGKNENKRKEGTSSNKSSNLFGNELPLVPNPPPQTMPQTQNDLGAFENGKKIRYFLRELKSIGRQVGATLNCDAEVDYSRLTAVKPNKKLLNVECASTKTLQKVPDSAVDSSLAGDISQRINLPLNAYSSLPKRPFFSSASSDLTIRDSMDNRASRIIPCNDFAEWSTEQSEYIDEKENSTNYVQASGCVII